MNKKLLEKVNSVNYPQQKKRLSIFSYFICPFVNSLKSHPLVREWLFVLDVQQAYYSLLFKLLKLYCAGFTRFDYFK